VRLYKFWMKDIFLHTNKIFYKNKMMFLISFITSLVSISSVVSFFIPIKIILILESPSMLNLFISENLSINLLFSGLILIFCISVYISIFGKLYLNKISLHLRQQLWETHKIKEDISLKKATFDRTLKKTLAIYADIITLSLILFLVSWLDYMVAIFIFSCFVAFLFYTQKTAQDMDKTYEYQTLLQTLSNACFYMTFILILTLYFSGIKIVLISTLLAFMLSRVYFRSLQQFSINSISLYKEFNKK